MSRSAAHISLLFLLMALLLSCVNRSKEEKTTTGDNAVVKSSTNDSLPVSRPLVTPSIGDIDPDSIVAFSRTLIGVPYLYASTDPAKGFDCSGFITYVFKHFGMQVPRSSVDFTNYGRDMIPELAMPGDLILFTGTDSTVRVVGHMGIVESIRNDTLHFIHSTSGKAKGVVITPMGNYYNSRFVKIIRVFPDHFFD